MARRIRLRIAYDGTDFLGFQAQPGRRTVQEVLQTALSTHCGEPVHVYGAGRTDAGVHASGQVVHFDTESRTPPERYPEAMGKHLPRDLVVLKSEEASGEFHARFSAVSRVYRYAILPEGRSPLLGRYAWMPQETPDWSVFQSESEKLVGQHDFRCFRSGTEERSTVRNMLSVRFRQERGAGLLTLEGNAFLRGMVRWIVGALWSRAAGKMEASGFAEMLAGRSRPKTLVPAPPQGLCLVKVNYGDRWPGVGDR